MVSGSRRAMLVWGWMRLLTLTEGGPSGTGPDSSREPLSGLMWVMLLPSPDEHQGVNPMISRRATCGGGFLPLTFSAALLDTVPYLLLAMQVNIPESSAKTSAITKVQMSSKGETWRWSSEASS